MLHCFYWKNIWGKKIFCQLVGRWYFLSVWLHAYLASAHGWTYPITCCLSVVWTVQQINNNNSSFNFIFEVTIHIHCNLSVVLKIMFISVHSVSLKLYINISIIWTLLNKVMIKIANITWNVFQKSVSSSSVPFTETEVWLIRFSSWCQVSSLPFRLYQTYRPDRTMHFIMYPGSHKQEL
jgi:hypothetical protein